jgi:hypothetical protein
MLFFIQLSELNVIQKIYSRTQFHLETCNFDIFQFHCTVLKQQISKFYVYWAGKGLSPFNCFIVHAVCSIKLVFLMKVSLVFYSLLVYSCLTYITSLLILL